MKQCFGSTCKSLSFSTQPFHHPNLSRSTCYVPSLTRITKVPKKCINCRISCGWCRISECPVIELTFRNIIFSTGNAITVLGCLMGNSINLYKFYFLQLTLHCCQSTLLCWQFLFSVSSSENLSETQPKITTELQEKDGKTIN